MSSVQSFLRQRVVGTTTFSAPADSQNDADVQLYQFVAGSAAAGTTAYAAYAASNYVGNYPPGYLVPGPLVSDLKTNAGGALVNPILRDLGKTIKASLADDAVATVFGAPGFWREVQVIDPSTVSGPTASTNNGVTGSGPGLKPAGNTGDAGYNTYYIPIVVGGVVPGTAAATSLPLAVGTSSYPSLIPGNVL